MVLFLSKVEILQKGADKSFFYLHLLSCIKLKPLSRNRNPTIPIQMRLWDVDVFQSLKD